MHHAERGRAALQRRPAFPCSILNNSRMFMLPCKTSLAFQMSADRLFMYCNEVYFWTFTFRQVPRNDDWAMWQWANLMRAFKTCFPLHKGVRVVELHETHGIHYHALINRRIAMDVIRRIAYPFGFGVMWVEHCDNGTAGYLAKYLTKSYRAENHFTKGRRRWGNIGRWANCKVRDLIMETSFTRSKSTLYGEKQISFGLALVLGSWVKLWGEVDEWPLDIRKQWLLTEATQKQKEMVNEYNDTASMVTPLSVSQKYAFRGALAFVGCENGANRVSLRAGNVLSLGAQLRRGNFPESAGGRVGTLELGARCGAGESKMDNIQ